jgi:hypothetical protein
MAAVVLPLPGPVFTMMSPRRMSDILGKLLIVPVWQARAGTGVVALGDSEPNLSQFGISNWD